MAESQAIAKQALKKLEDQLTCAICLDAFKDPKLLQCFHVYCKDCLQRLVVTDTQGQLSVRCPTCRQSTLLPQATGVSGLQPAFHIHHLFEIQEALKKVKYPEKVKCEKCRKSRPATKFCKDCGKFICERCLEMHSDWEEFSNHEVVSMEQVQSNVKQLVPPKKVTLYCSQHQGKELELYCETCEELICLHCTVKKHKDHQYDLVGDTFQRHEAEITASLEPVEKQLGAVAKALEEFDLQSLELDNLRATLEASIQREIRKLQELLEARKADLTHQVQQLIQVKKKNLAAQKDELEILHTQLASCQSFVRESLRTGSQGEVIKMKKTVVNQINEMTDNFKPDILTPRELYDVQCVILSDLASACQQFGEVYLQQVSPEKCYATGEGLKVAKFGQIASLLLQIVDNKGQAYNNPVETLVTSELVSEDSAMQIDLSMKKSGCSGQYEISYQATSRGRHQLHIKVEGKHINGSPFPVTVNLPVQKLGAPIKTITGMKSPWGVAVSSRGNIIVSEDGGHCISIFNPSGAKIQSFGSLGSNYGQFSHPGGVAVDDEDNILVADYGNNRIQKFTSDGKFVSAVIDLELHCPMSVAIHPQSKKVYVADGLNHRVVIANSDLTFSSSFGWSGSDKGQFQYPYDVAFDSAGNLYVVDRNNHRIQVFTEAGQYLRQFGQRGSGNGELNGPTSISIDSEDVVYVTESNKNCVSVFTCEGKFLTSFGNEGIGPGQFKSPYGIAVDKDGLIYVTDTTNLRLQIF